jgi:hypothetical protein
MAPTASVHQFIPRNELSAPAPDDSAGLQPIDVSEPGLQAQDPQITSNDDGTIAVDFGGDDASGYEGTEANDPNEHDANLAEFLDDTELNAIAQEVLEMVEVDLESRKGWYQRLAKGLDLLGIMDEKDFKPPFSGASTATHPLIAEAVVQFQSRAIAELVPAKGPCKALVMGDSNDELEKQSERVEQYMNYQLMVEDRTYFPEMDQLLFLLATEGSEFKKVYRDPLTNKNVSRLVRAEDFIVPYGATTLENAPRFTHAIEYAHNDFLRCVKSGFYCDADVVEPSTRDATDLGSITLRDAKDTMDGAAQIDIRPEDRPHMLYEMHVDYVVRGMDGASFDGSGQDIALPYIISVERDTPKVVAIRRNWKETDENRQKRVSFVHYPFIRGTGFYGFGFIHLLGGLGKAATGVLRLMIDNGAFAGLQGGFKSKEAKLPSNVEVGPGKWVDTEMTHEDLQKAFYTPPYKDVPVSLFHLLGAIDDAGRRFATTTEAVVGDAKNTGPVGTTVALIEQGSKVFSAIHKRCHYAQGEELRLLAELNGEALPTGEEGGYPYDVPGASRTIMREDFSDRVSIVPVSDPNIFSSTQRIAIAQSTLELAEKSPGLYDMREANRRVLEALRVPSWEELMPDKTDVKRYDPVTENSLAILGQPIRVFVDQDHKSHNAVHDGLLAQLQAQMKQQPSPQLQAAISSLGAHRSEHEAFSVMLAMASEMGVPPMMLDPYAKKGKGAGQSLPPEIENMVAQKAAGAVAQMAQRAQVQAVAQQAQQAVQQKSQAQAEQDHQTITDHRDHVLEQHGEMIANAHTMAAARAHGVDAKTAALDAKQQQVAAAKPAVARAAGGDQVFTALMERVLTMQSQVDERMASSEQMTATALAGLTQSFTNLSDQISTATKMIVTASTMPKKLVLDKDGNPIGTAVGNAEEEKAEGEV